MAFTAVFESCEETNHPLYAAGPMLALNPKLLCMLGDDPYYAIAIKYGSYDIPNLVVGTTVQQIEDRVHGMFAKPGWQELLAYRATGAMRISWAGGDDHRWANAADHTVTQAESGGEPIGTPGTVTQAQVNEVSRRWSQAHRNLGNTYWDFPTNASMQSYNGDLPSEPARVGVPMLASEFPIIYHYLDYGIDGTPGGKHVRFIIPDHISYRSPVLEADTPAKTMLGATQKAWFMAAVRDAWAQGFQHVVPCMNKKLYNRELPASGRYGTAENDDTWGNYPDERDEIFGTLYNEGIRMVHISGDRHTPQVVRRTVAEHGAAFDCLDVMACPVGVINNAGGQGDILGQVWMRCSPEHHETVFVSVRFEDDGRMRIDVRAARSGLIRWGCWVAPRSNTPMYV